jgi:hypothetical protein
MRDEKANVLKDSKAKRASVEAANLEPEASRPLQAGEESATGATKTKVEPNGAMAANQVAVTSYLVEAHGGKIYADSNGEGHGSTFTVHLPIVC